MNKRRLYMKGKLLVGVTIVLTLVLCLSMMVACSTRQGEGELPGEEGNGDEQEETVIIRTVEIQNGKGRTLESYEKGQEISLKADLVANVQFVYWTENGEVLSYSREVKYVVDDDVVLRAVYTTEGEVTIDPAGGQLLGRGTTVILTEKKEGVSEKTKDTEGVLYYGYGYKLPVSEKNRYIFRGYSLNGELVTDEKGRSIAPFEGTNSVFVAEYTEKDFVIVNIYNDETEELQKTEKVYLEDGSAMLSANDVTDRTCTGVKRENGESLSSGKNFTLDLTDKNLTPGEELSFYATYREAYKFNVTSSEVSGNGSYTMDEPITIEADVPRGKNFTRWTAEIADGSTYVLGYKTLDEDRVYCFISESGYIYYDEEAEEQVVVPFASNEYADIQAGTHGSVSFAGRSLELTLTDLVRLGATVAGGARLILNPEFIQKAYTLTYYVNCIVNGQYCLDADGEEALADNGFALSPTEEGTYFKVEYLDAGETIYYSSVPAINHYRFINWQNAQQGEDMPTKMRESFAVKGTFRPDSHKITVDCEIDQGAAKIGRSGNITTGYYDYGTLVEFYVRADAGYRFYEWLDIEGVHMNLTNTDTVEGESIDYYFTYRVERDETLNVRFTERGYYITYLLTVLYDGRDVTQDPTFFEQNGYVENYWQDSEMRLYGEVGGLKEKPVIKGTSTPDGIPLIYGSGNWAVSEWVCDTDIGDPNNFIMPKNDIVVRSTCEIVSYSFSFTRQDGVTGYTVTEINGKEAEEYETGTGSTPVYYVPFGSVVGMQISYGEGYTRGVIRANGMALDAESGYSYDETDDRYVFDVEFSMLKSDPRVVNYSLFAETNLHNISYYVAWDYEHADERVSLDKYFTIDLSSVKVWNGKSYYGVISVADGNEWKTINRTGVTYYDGAGGRTEIREEDVRGDANAAMYNISAWRKVVERSTGDELYSDATMPDDSIWMFADLTLMRFTVNISERRFEFDDEFNNFSTASVTKLKENAETQEYTYQSAEDFEYAVGGYLYYSEITLRSFDPTGYDFSEWIVTNGTGVNEVTDSLDVTPGGYDLVRTTSHGYRYYYNDDGTVTLLLGNTLSVNADFSIRILHASVESNDSYLQIRKRAEEGEMAGSWASECDFEYGSKLEMTYNFSLLRGEYLEEVYFVSETQRVETISSGFVLSTISYVKSTNNKTISETTEEIFTDDVQVYSVRSNIAYEITYYVYPAADNMNGIDGDPVAITQDANGDPFTVYYNTEGNLINEATLLALAEAADMDVENVIFSGWYNKTNSVSEEKMVSSANNDVEGAALVVNNQYSENKTYTHTSHSVHPDFRCYLINIYTATSGQGVTVNSKIKETSTYKQHLCAKHPTMTVPSSFGGATVLRIAERAFENLTELEEVIIPSTVIRIGNYAFHGCTGLTETGLHNAIQAIGEHAYEGCTNIGEVVIGEVVTEIGREAFSGMTNLSAVTYNTMYAAVNANISLGILIFRNSGSNTNGGYSFTIGKNVAFIDNKLFYYNGNTAASGNLGTVSFEEGTGANGVTFATNALAYTAIHTFNTSDRIASFGEYVFKGCGDLETFDFAEATALTTVPAHMFESSGIEEVLLSEGITEVEEYAFMDCTHLVSVYYRNDDGLAVVGDGAFSDVEGKKEGIIRMVHYDLKEDVDGGSEDYDEIRLENLTSVGDYAFAGCKFLKKIVLCGEDVTFGKKILADGPALKYIGYGAQEGTTSTEANYTTFTGIGATGCQLVIDESVENIPDYAFYDLLGVSSVTIPSTITSLGTSSFGAMANLTDIYFNLNRATIGSNVFYNSGSQTGLTLTLGSNVTRVASSAFSGITRLTALVVPEAVNADLEIGSYAFNGTHLATFTVPQRRSLIIRENALGNTLLSTVSLHASIADVTIEKGAFSANNDGRIGSMNVTAFGRTMTALWGKLTSGSFNVVYSSVSGKYTGTLRGQMTTTSGVNFTVGKTDEFIIDGENVTLSRLTVTSQATINGKLTKVNDGVIATGANATLTGVTYDKNDLLTKIALGAYTHMIVDETSEAVALTTAQTITLVGFTDNKGITLSEGITFDTDTLTVAQGKTMSVQEKIEVTGELDGDLSVSAGAEVIVNGKRYLNDGSVTNQEAANGYGYGVYVESGTIHFAANEWSKMFSVSSGSTLTANYDYTQEADECLELLGTASFVAEKDVVLYVYSGSASAGFSTTATGSIRFDSLQTTSLNASISSVVSLILGDDVVYYGALQKAITMHQKSSPTYVLEADVTGSGLTVSALGSSETLTLDFNGHTVALSGTLEITAGGLTLVDADLTVEQILHSAEQGGSITVSSGTVTGDGGTIVANGSVTVNAGATVELTTSTSAYAIEASYVSILGSVVSSGNGVYVHVRGSGNTVGLSINGGSVEATGANATAVNVMADQTNFYFTDAEITGGKKGVFLSGTNAMASFGGTTSVAGATALHSAIRRNILASTALTVASTVTLTGTKAGAYLTGTGVCNIAGTVSATAVGGLDGDLVASGAIVAEEGETVGRLRVNLTGTATNNTANGDALVYVALEADATLASFGFFPIGASEATVTGGVTEIKRAYVISVSSSEKPEEIYEKDTNNDMILRARGADLESDRYEYMATNRINVAGRGVVSDKNADIGEESDPTIRCISYFATVADAIANGGIVRIDENYTINSNFSATMVTTGAVTVAESATLSGTIALKGAGTMTIASGKTLTVTGGLFGIGENSRTIFVNNGTLNVTTGTITLPWTCTLDNNSVFGIRTNAAAYVFGSIDTTNSTMIVEGSHTIGGAGNFVNATLTINGTVNMPGITDQGTKYNNTFENTVINGNSGLLTISAEFSGKDNVVKKALNGTLEIAENSSLLLRKEIELDSVKMAATSSLTIEEGGAITAISDLDGHSGLYGTITIKNRCSELCEKHIAGYDGTEVTVMYDECNPFGILAGEFDEATIHSEQEVSSADVESAFDDLGEAFGEFYAIKNDADSEKVLNAFVELYGKAVEVYQNNSLPNFSRNATNNNSAKGAVVGINYSYKKTGDSAYSAIDIKTAIARIFGYSTGAAFTEDVGKLAARANSMSGALSNGCFHTENGYYIYPIAVANRLSSTVLLHVFLAANGNVTVWVNDIEELLKATNSSSQYTSSGAITNELYCKDALFINEINPLRFESDLTVKGTLTTMLTNAVKVIIEGSLTTTGTLNIGGKWTIGEDVTVESGELNVLAASFEVGGDVVVNQGKIAFRQKTAADNNTEGLSADTITLKGGAGMEYIYGRVSFGSDVKMEPGSWLYRETATASNVAYTTANGASEEYTQDVYGFSGSKTGTVVSYCASSHVERAYGETCYRAGFNGCAYEVYARLMTGVEIMIKHDRADVFYSGTAEHTYITENSTTHYCAVCGKTEAHDFTEMRMADTTEYSFELEGEQVFIVSYYCADCDYRSDPTEHAFSANITEAELNVALKWFHIEQFEVDAKMTCGGYSSTRLAVENNAGIFTDKDGNEYYLVELFFVQVGLQANRYFVLVCCDDDKLYENNATARPDASGTTVTDTVTAGGDTVTIVMPTGEDRFDLTGVNTVTEAEEMLEEYGLSGWALYKGDYPADEAETLASIRAYYYEVGVNKYDLIKLYNENLHATRYAVVQHTCNTYTPSAGYHVCAECGASENTAHALNALSIEPVMVDGGNYMLYVLCRYCPVCGEKEHIFLSGRTLADVATELAALGTISLEMKKNNGEVGTFSVSPILAESTGTSLFDIHTNMVRLASDGNYYLSEEADDENIQGIDMLPIYVKFEYDHVYRYEKVCTVFVYVFSEEQDTKNITSNGGNPVGVTNGQTQVGSAPSYGSNRTGLYKELYNMGMTDVSSSANGSKWSVATRTSNSVASTSTLITNVSRYRITDNETSEYYDLIKLRRGTNNNVTATTYVKVTYNGTSGNTGTLSAANEVMDIIKQKNGKAFYFTNSTTVGELAAMLATGGYDGWTVLDASGSAASNSAAINTISKYSYIDYEENTNGAQYDLVMITDGGEDVKYIKVVYEE